MNLVQTFQILIPKFSDIDQAGGEASCVFYVNLLLILNATASVSVSCPVAWHDWPPAPGHARHSVQPSGRRQPQTRVRIHLPS